MRKSFTALPIMGATPSHGTTMGYVSDPFRTEEQNPGRASGVRDPSYNTKIQLAALSAASAVA